MLDEVIDAVHTGVARSPEIVEAHERVLQVRERSKPQGVAGDSAPPRYSRASKKIGDLGERLVFEYLKRRLREAGREDLADRVVWHQEAAEDRTPGWDITSYDTTTGEAILVEVKATQSSTLNEVILTRNEWKAAQRHGAAYWLYLVSDVLKPVPRLETLRNPVEYHRQGLLQVEEASWSVRL